MTSSTDPSVRIIKSGLCPSVTGKSKVGYQFGRDEAGNVAVRITTNSGGGFYSKEWVALSAIEKAVGGAETGLSSGTLRAIFRGKSVNTAGFLLAVLKHEGAVRPKEGKTRLYEVADFAGLQAHTSAGAGKPTKPRGRSGAPTNKAIPKPSSRSSR